MTSATQPQFAIVNGLVIPKLKVWAIAEIATYDVWDEPDGPTVNQTYWQGKIKIPCEVTVSNVPRFPGASDAYRAFSGESGSIEAMALFSYHPSDKAIKKALGITCQIETEGDDRHIYVNRERDGYPLGELAITGYCDNDS